MNGPAATVSSPREPTERLRKRLLAFPVAEETIAES